MEAMELNLNEIFVLKQELESITAFSTLKTQLDSELEKIKTMNESFVEERKL